MAPLIVAINLLTCTVASGLSVPYVVGQAEIARIWYALPLVVVVSLVYGGTRHEYLTEIMVHSFRSAVWVVGFMGVIFLIIYVAGFWN